MTQPTGHIVDNSLVLDGMYLACIHQMFSPGEYY